MQFMFNCDIVGILKLIDHNSQLLHALFDHAHYLFIYSLQITYLLTMKSDSLLYGC